MNKKIKSETETSPVKSTKNTEKSAHHKTAVEEVHTDLPAVIEESTIPTPPKQIAETITAETVKTTPQEAVTPEQLPSEEIEKKERDLQAQETVANKQLENLWSNGRAQLINQFPSHPKR